MDHIKPDGVTYVRTLAKTHSGGVILCLLDYIIIETHVRTYVRTYVTYVLHTEMIET